MSDDDEIDFMSDALLQPAAAGAPTSKGNLSYTERRRQAANRSFERGRVQSRREQEREAREEGLRTNLMSAPSAAENKALGMMKKMGFMPGQALGKQKAVDPILEDKKEEPAFDPFLRRGLASSKTAGDKRLEPIKIQMPEGM